MDTQSFELPSKSLLAMIGPHVIVTTISCVLMDFLELMSHFRSVNLTNSAPPKLNYGTLCLATTCISGEPAHLQGDWPMPAVSMLQTKSELAGFVDSLSRAGDPYHSLMSRPRFWGLSERQFFQQGWTGRHDRCRTPRMRGLDISPHGVQISVAPQSHCIAQRMYFLEVG